MNEKYTYYLRYACISSALAAALALGGCSSGERGVATQNEAVAANAQDGQAAVSLRTTRLRALLPACAYQIIAHILLFFDIFHREKRS